jgi:glycosyltransferase involved in cell wall biosynthesis
VTLASFVRPEEEVYVESVRQVCAAVHTVPIRRSKFADLGYWLRSHLTGRPFLIERDDLEDMRSLVARLLESERIDLIHADQLGMTQFALPYADGKAGVSSNGSTEPVLVFDAHNAVWTIVERMLQTASPILKPAAALEARRVKRYEGRVIRTFDHTLAVTEPDRQALMEAAAAGNGQPHTHPSDPITVVPIAVDTQVLQPIHRRPGSTNLVTLGTLHYPPNADGIRWFARDVFPLIQQRVPEASLTIVGKNPPPDFLQLARQQPDRVTVTGYLPDLTPALESAALMVVAVRAGGGMRVRILEAFARAMPVVTTTVGLEGIEAEPGRDVLVADSPEDFAAAVIRLIQDPGLAEQLAANGRRLAETRYDWQVILQKMDPVFTAAVHSHHA